jgi:hypothetical protein
MPAPGDTTTPYVSQRFNAMTTGPHEDETAEGMKKVVQKAIRRLEANWTGWEMHFDLKGKKDT